MRNYADMHKFTTKSLIKGVPINNYNKARSYTPKGWAKEKKYE